jgi:hypothetical protein
MKIHRTASGLLCYTGTLGEKQRSRLFQFAPVPRSSFDRHQLRAFDRRPVPRPRWHGYASVETPLQPVDIRQKAK